MLLSHPSDVVNYYFNKIGFCRKSIFSAIIRHNYAPIRLSKSKMILRCKHCGQELVNNNLPSFSKKARKELWIKELNKNKGDISIYLIYWRKNDLSKFLNFPGLFYIGQTKKNVKERVYGSNSSHFFRAFNNPKSAIEHTIKKYGNIHERAMKIFKAEVLQIIQYQGTKIETRKLANNIEKFWIGFFHSQFDEFGRNIEAGGSRVYKSIIVPFEFLDNALYEASKLPRCGSIERKHYVYDKLGLKRSQNRILDNSFQFWYGFKSNKFALALKLKRCEIIKKLFEQGFKVAFIAKEINADRHDIIKWIENDIYKDEFLNSDYKKIRRLVLGNKIIAYISSGIKTPNLLYREFKGIQNEQAIKHLIRQIFGSWNALIEKYYPKENYWLKAKDLFIERKNMIELGVCKEYNVIEFARALGSNTNYSSSAIKFIRRKLNTNMNWIQIKNIFSLYKNT